MVKSPISFLQEFAIKQGYVPMYNFLTNDTGKNNQFFCQVICKDLSANGIGNSKREAKQKAAENMLLLLNQTSYVSMSSISSLCRDANNTEKSALICNTPSSSIHLQLKSEVPYIKKDITMEETSINYIGLLQVSPIKYDFSANQNNAIFILCIGIMCTTQNIAQ